MALRNGIVLAVGIDPDYFAGGAFAAGDYPGLVADYDPGAAAFADDGTTPAAVGQAVYRVSDPESGRHVRQAAADNRPTLTAGGPGDRPYLRFAGSHYLTGTGTSEWAALHDGTDFTLYLLVRFRPQDAGQTGGMLGTSANTPAAGRGLTWYFGDDGANDQRCSAVVQVMRSTTPTATTRVPLGVIGAVGLRWTVLALRRLGTQYTLFCDGAERDDWAQSNAPSAGDHVYPFQIGACGNAALPLRGDVARLTAYAGAGGGHDDATVLAASAALRAAYWLDPAPPDPDVTVRTVQTAAAGGFGAYQGFPATARWGDTVLVHWQDSATHDGDGRLMQRVSADGGATWGAATEVLARSNVRETPSDSMIRLPSGRLVELLAVTADPAGTPALRTDVIYSDDDGATWSSPYTVPTPAGQDYCFAYGRPVRLASGRLLAPAYSSTTAFLLRSDDDGETWAHHADIAGDAGGQVRNEAAVRLAADGTLRAAVRRYPDETKFELYRSPAPHTAWALDGYASVGTSGLQPAWLDLGGGRVALFGTDRTHGGGSAECIQAFVSLDDGDTFGDRICLYAQTYGNSNLGHPSPVLLDSGRVGVAFYANRSSGKTELFWADVAPQVFTGPGEAPV